MKLKQYEVLFMGDNVWTIDGKPHIFNSATEAAIELAEHFKDMDDSNMDYEPSDYQIEEISNDSTTTQ